MAVFYWAGFSSQFLTDLKVCLYHYACLGLYLMLSCCSSSFPALFSQPASESWIQFLCILFFFFSFLFISFPVSLPTLISNVDSELLLKATVGLLPQRTRFAPKPELILAITHFRTRSKSWYKAAWYIYINHLTLIPSGTSSLWSGSPSSQFYSTQFRRANWIQSLSTTSSICCSILGSQLRLLSPSLISFVCTTAPIRQNEEHTHSFAPELGSFTCIVRDKQDSSALCRNTFWLCLLIICRAAKPGAPAHPGSSSLQVRSNERCRWINGGMGKQNRQKFHGLYHVFLWIALLWVWFSLIMFLKTVKFKQK